MNSRKLKIPKIKNIRKTFAQLTREKEKMYRVKIAKVNNLLSKYSKHKKFVCSKNNKCEKYQR